MNSWLTHMDRIDELCGPWLWLHNKTETERCSPLKHCRVSLQNLMWFKPTEHATRPHSCLCSLSFAHSHTHSCLHLDGRRCVTNGNTLSFDELIFSLLMLTGHTLRKHSLTPFYVLECSRLIIQPNPFLWAGCRPLGPEWFGLFKL